MKKASFYSVFVILFSFLLSSCGGPSNQSSGYSSNQSTGNPSNQSSGYSSNQSAGNPSNQSSGYSSNQSTGNSSNQSSEVLQDSSSAIDIDYSPKVAPNDVIQQIAYLGTGGGECRVEVNDWWEKTDDGMYIFGFSSYQSLRILVYTYPQQYEGLDYSEFITQWRVTVGENGTATLRTTKNPDNYIYLVYNQSGERIEGGWIGCQAIVPLNDVLSSQQTSSQEDTDNKYSCSSNINTRLNVGARARVTITNGVPVRVRTEPVVSQSTYKTQIDEGTEMTIKDGPACNDGYIWWYIETEGGTTGWVAEGSSGDWLLEPIP